MSSIEPAAFHPRGPFASDAPRGETAATAGMKLSVSGTNLTNKLPDWSTFFRGYDILNYDIVGRAIFVRAKFQL